ncbi:MAG: hypothetical protein WC462_03470 [archaeon]
MAKKRQSKGSKKKDSFGKAALIALELAEKKENQSAQESEISAPHSEVVLEQKQEDIVGGMGKSSKEEKSSLIKKPKKLIVKPVKQKKKSAQKLFTAKTETTLVEIVKENPSEEDNIVEETNEGTDFEDSVQKNTDLIEIVGGVAMVLIAVEVVAIISLLIFIFFL